MFNNLETGGNLSTLTEEELEAAMGPVEGKKKPSTKSPDTDKDKDKNKGKDKPTKTQVKPTTKKPEITTLSSKDAATAFDNDDDDDDEDSNKNKGGKDDDDQDDDDETVVTDNEDDTDDEEEKPNEDNDEEPEEQVDEEDRIKDFLKARAELLIKKGEWADWEDRDKTEWDEETFAEMELQQRQNIKDKMREELLTAFGPYGKQIAEFSENGGDPDELIDIFKEEQKVQALSIDTEDSQRDIVFLYETQFLNKKPERVNKYIDSLITDKELANEAKEAKEKMEDYWKSQREEAVEEQAEKAKKAKTQQQESLTKFSGEVTKYVTAEKGIPDAEKQNIIKVLTKFDKKGPNGTPVNDFFFKFAEFKKDLPNYIDLVRFVLDPKKFSKQLKNEGKSESVEKGFSLIRQNNKGKKNRSSGSGSSGSKKSNFKLMY